jgi:CheY-like chemotaxis protein
MGQQSSAGQVALVVEDNADLRSLAATILEETHLSVVEASSGEAALRYLNANAGEVALLFADVRLSHVMTGIDVARLVRLKWPWIKTVLTSGEPLDEDLDKALASVRFLPKPWRALDVLVEAEKAASQEIQ